MMHTLQYMLSGEASRQPLPILNSIFIHSHYKLSELLLWPWALCLYISATEINKTLQGLCPYSSDIHLLIPLEQGYGTYGAQGP